MEKIVKKEPNILNLEVHQFYGNPYCCKGKHCHSLS